MKGGMMERFELDVTQWRRGEGCNSLYNEDNTSCCLGLLGQFLGIEPENMRQTGYPSNLGGSLPWIFPAKLYQLEDDSECALTNEKRIAQVNDHPGWTEQFRRNRLVQHFAELGYELVFVGE